MVKSLLFLELNLDVVVQLLNHVRLFAAPWTTAHEASLSCTVSRSLLKFMSIESVMPSNHLILCRPLLVLPSIFPSIRVFFNGSALCIRWPKYWNFSLSISPSNEYSGLISFMTDWFLLLAVQGTLKSLLQCDSSKVSILQHSTFFIVGWGFTLLSSRTDGYLETSTLLFPLIVGMAEVWTVADLSDQAAWTLAKTSSLNREKWSIVACCPEA